MLRRAIGLAASLSLFGAAGATFSACLLPGIDPAGTGGFGAGNEGGASLGDGGSPTCSAPPLAEQPAGDCRVLVCNDEGVIGEVFDDTDVPADAPPPCTSWRCSEGIVETAPASDCTECCGADDELNCIDGACVGCGEPRDCGDVDTCYDWECRSDTCIQVPLEGPCGNSTCSQTAPGMATQTAGVCVDSICQPLGAPCGNYTCDGDVCFEACSSLGADLACQPGTDCKGVECDDCATCAEVIAAGDIVNRCPMAAILIEAMIECYCQGGGVPAVCASSCPAACPGHVASDACFSCLYGASGCTGEKTDCQQDTDPVP